MAPKASKCTAFLVSGTSATLVRPLVVWSFWFPPFLTFGRSVFPAVDSANESGAAEERGPQVGLFWRTAACRVYVLFFFCAGVTFAARCPWSGKHWRRRPTWPGVHCVRPRYEWKYFGANPSLGFLPFPARDSMTGWMTRAHSLLSHARRQSSASKFRQVSKIRVPAYSQVPFSLFFLLFIISPSLSRTRLCPLILCQPYKELSANAQLLPGVAQL